MVEVSQGEIWWANRSRIATVVCVPLTSNLTWVRAPGNVFLPATVAGLSKDSVANASQIIAVDRACLAERLGKLPSPTGGNFLTPWGRRATRAADRRKD